MGYSASSHIVIGVRVRRKDFFVEKKVRGCRHQNTKDKFCAECGKPTWETKGNYSFNLGDLWEPNEDGISAVAGNCESDEYVIGLDIGNCGGYDNPNILLIKMPSDEQIAKLKKDLEKLLGGLYDENKFGLYNVFYES